MNQQQQQQMQQYQQYVEQKMPKSHLVRDCIRAFIVGGLICMIGQGVWDIGRWTIGLDEVQASSFMTVVMIFIGATLTGIGVYDKIGNFAGAGSIVPITGFANSIVAPAMEFKKEGYVMGVGAKMFALAGPVIVYGICSSILVGLIYFLFGGGV